MKMTEFEVVLEGLTVKQWAFNEEQATILAQAKAIQNARSHKFVSIKKLSA